MAKLRKIQFYRNGTAQDVAGTEQFPVTDLKSAYKQAEQDFIATGKHNDMLDGEILLYRFIYNDTVHTLVGVVHVSGATHSLEVLANYDMLGAEISNEISAAINALDVENVSVATETNGIVTFNGIKQEDGKIATGTIGISLAKVAKTGAAADVSIADTENVITATTVEGALAEIAKEINAMDYAATDVVALNADKTALQAGKISEDDGKIAVETATNVVEFNQALSANNKVATMADVTAAQNNATVVGQESIVVAEATGEGANGKVVSLKINTSDKVLSQNDSGLFSTLSIAYNTDAKQIELRGINDEVIGDAIDATNFIKDGMLSSAELVETAEEGITTEVPYLKFTWNADSGDQITRISVKKFIDTYSSGNSETLTVSDYTITPVTAAVAANATGLAVAGDVHAKIAATKGQDIQTITGETAISNGSSFVSTAVTATKGQNDDNYILSSTSTVKTQAVATAAAADGETPAVDGLATALDVKTYVDAKVGSEYTAEGELSMSNDRVITHNESGVITTEDGEVNTKTKGSVLTDVITNIPIIKVPVITVNKYGHVTTLTETPYEVKYPTVSGESGQIVITTTDAIDNAGTNYTVSLAKVVTGDATNVAPTESTDDYALKSVETTGPQQHTRVENITVDAYGRVTAYTLTTVEENWDCGSW